MSLSDLRKEIDQIDGDMLDLLRRRAEVVQEVGRQKTLSRSHYFTPEREQTVFKRLAGLNAGLLPPTAVRAIFREIISACRALEKPLSVAYLGPPGTFSHQAGMLKFGASTHYVATESITDIFLQVQQAHVHYGVTPIENSISGVIAETLDAFNNSDLRVVSELFVPIVHNLATRVERPEDVRKVYSKHEPFAQCRQWLRDHLPNVEKVEVSSTSRAAEIAAEEDGAAAICPLLAAQMNELPVLEEHIEDNPSNRTRFLVLGYNEPEPTGKDKTSITFCLPHRSGALFHAMAAFEKYDVNLLMIESRPSKGTSWEYVFYVDVQGHRKDMPVAESIKKLEEIALFVRVLGSYPAAE